MNANEVLTDGFGRVRDVVHRVCSEVDDAALVYRADPEANTIAWLLWHVGRVIDAQVAEIAGRDEVWESWHERFDLPLERRATGYGHSPAEVARVTAPATDLLGYFDDVHAMVVDFVSSLTEADLDRIIDRRWDPPVSAGVRLVSCIGDGLQHAGQAAYILGMAKRAEST